MENSQEPDPQKTAWSLGNKLALAGVLIAAAGISINLFVSGSGDRNSFGSVDGNVQIGDRHETNYNVTVQDKFDYGIKSDVTWLRIGDSSGFSLTAQPLEGLSNTTCKWDVEQTRGLSIKQNPSNTCAVTVTYSGYSGDRNTAGLNGQFPETISVAVDRDGEKVGTFEQQFYVADILEVQLKPLKAALSENELARLNVTTKSSDTLLSDDFSCEWSFPNVLDNIEAKPIKGNSCAVSIAHAPKDIEIKSGSDVFRRQMMSALPTTIAVSVIIKNGRGDSAGAIFESIELVSN